MAGTGNRNVQAAICGATSGEGLGRGSVRTSFKTKSTCQIARFGSSERQPRHCRSSTSELPRFRFDIIEGGNCETFAVELFRFLLSGLSQLFCGIVQRYTNPVGKRPPINFSGIFPKDFLLCGASKKHLVIFSDHDSDFIQDLDSTTGH